MGHNDARHMSLGRFLLFMLGTGLGVYAVVSYITQRRRKQTAAPTASAAAPPVGVRLKVAEQAEALLLAVSVIPEPLVAGEDATVRAQTTPGATCLIEARYSTGRPPSSLDAEPVEAGNMGECEWTWNVRTKGNEVMIAVQVWLEDHRSVREERVVEIQQT